MRIILQLLGLIILIPTVALGALRYKYSGADGPSILFPGGELTSGAIYNGPEPNWDFTANIQTIELQLNAPIRSRLVRPVPVNGRLYIVSGNMGSIFARIWRPWAVDAHEGDGTALVRINGIRYQRRLMRIYEGSELDGVANVLSNKYGLPITRQSIESGKYWVFEVARGGRTQ